jgi:hypothetical protein
VGAYLRRCTICGSINFDYQQAYGVCGSALAGTAPSLELDAGTRDPLEKPGRSKKNISHNPGSRNKFWAGLVLLLLFFGLLLGTVVLFSSMSTTETGTSAPFSISGFDLIFLWTGLLFAGIAALRRLFKMIGGD